MQPAHDDKPVALYPAPVAKVAAEIGASLRADLLPLLTEAVRRAQLGEYLSQDEAERELGLSGRQIRRLRETRGLPYIKQGARTIVYPTADVFAFMEAGRIHARDPAP